MHMMSVRIDFGVMDRHRRDRASSAILLEEHQSSLPAEQPGSRRISRFRGSKTSCSVRSMNPRSI